MKTLLHPALADLKFDAVCTLKRAFSNRPICSRPAEYACRLACCGHIKIVCSAHRNISESVLPKLFVCSRCRAQAPAVASCWPV